MDIKALKLALAADLEKCAKIKADMATCKPEDMQSQLTEMVNSIYNSMSNMRDYIYSDINYLHDRISKHLDGHLPAIKGAAAMNKALKSLGCDGDYQVQKQTVYASCNGQLTAVIDLKPENK